MCLLVNKIIHGGRQRWLTLLESKVGGHRCSGERCLSRYAGGALCRPHQASSILRVREVNSSGAEADEASQQAAVSTGREVLGLYVLTTSP